MMSFAKGADTQGMPKTVKISVTAHGGQQSNDKKKPLYTEKVLEFEMQLMSEIKVETKYRKGVQLCPDTRR